MLVLLSRFPFPPSSRPMKEALGHAGKMRSWEKYALETGRPKSSLSQPIQCLQGPCLPWDAPNSCYSF